MSLKLLKPWFSRRELLRAAGAGSDASPPRNPLRSTAASGCGRWPASAPTAGWRRYPVSPGQNRPNGPNLAGIDWQTSATKLVPLSHPRCHKQPGAEPGRRTAILPNRC